MITEVNENVVVWTRFQRFLGTNSHVFSAQNIQKVLWSNEFSSVIFWNAFVDITTTRTVDDGALLGVLRVVGNIILHENDNLGIRNTILFQDLISVANI